MSERQTVVPRCRLPRLPFVAAILLAGACDRTAETAEPRPDEAASSPMRIDAENGVQWKLPDALKEISGLALSADGRLFAHDDERAVIYQLDPVEGKIEKSFAFGEVPVRGDFEGIAWIDGGFALATSRGELYLGPEGGPDDRVAFDRYDPGLARECEFEGLGFDPETRVLLLPCKVVRSDAEPAGLKIFAWSPDAKKRRADLDVAVRTAALQKISGAPDFPASGIEVDPRSGHRYLVSARRSLLLELSPTGEPLAALALPFAARHRQTEGIAIGPDGELFLADEGGNRRARLAVYRLAR